MKLLVVVIGFLALSNASSDFEYPHRYEDEPFPKWGGLCDSGKHQSPINLNVKGALKGEFEQLKFNNYDEHQDGVRMVNTGHSIQLYGFEDELTLKGGPLLEDYVVEQLHMHWWSEHTINSIRYPLEVHVVHRNKLYPNMSMAANFKDGITVIGVLYHVSHTPNDAITEIINSLDGVKNHSDVNRPMKMKDAFAVRDLFPDIKGYFTYEGSLTTPTCAEAVTWIVLTETFPVTLAQVEEFKEIEYDDDKHLENNYRELQAVNSRAVVYVTEHEPKALGGGATRATLCLSVPLASTLLMLGISKLWH